MKKILLILCALVCGTLAFAQTTGSYTDNLHVVVNGDDEGVQQGTVTIEYQDDDKSYIDFTLHEFSVDIYLSGALTSLYLGDVTVKDVILGEEVDGVATFSCTDDHDVEYPDVDEAYSSMISDVTVNMTGDVSETKLHANMEITVSLSLMGLIPLGDYPITATFGYDYGEYLVMNSEGNYLGGGLDWGTHATEIGKPQFFSFIEGTDGTYTLNGHQGSSTSVGWDQAGTALYIDGVSPLTWELVAADGGGYYIACDDGYLKSNGLRVGASIADLTTNATVWKLVTLEEAIAGMEDATFDNPVEVTPLIPAPEPKHNSYKDSWTATGYNETAVPNNYCFGGPYGWEETSVCESYHSTNGFDIRQTIPDLPAGFYTLTAEAFYRNDGGKVIPSIYVTTGTCATDADGILTFEHLPLLETEVNDMAGAYEEFLEKKHTVSINFEVDEDGTDITVGFESNVEDDDVMWTIFGELSLYYDGTEAPELEGVTGMMNADVETTLTAALEAYASTPSSATYSAALNAIEAATESVAYYAEVTAAIDSKDYEAVVATFDDAGQAAFQSDFLDAYTNRTLTDQTIEEGLSDACKKQTTEFCDMSYALKNSGEWTNAIGASSFQLCPQLSTAHEIWSESAWKVTGRDVTENKAIYKQIEGLPEGTYTLSFYAYGNAGETPTYGRPLAYANDADEQEVAYLADLGSEWTAASLYTFICEVGEDGILEFGMNTQGDGNWYVMEEYSLTFGVEEEDPYIYDITSLLANPSFEDDDVSELTADSGRGYSITELTGWELDGPNGENAHKDIMTAESTETDNNYGVPGAPSAGSQMLYLRDAWAANTGSVMQSVVLPAGEYKLTVDTKCVASDPASHSATLVVGEESKALTIHATENGTDETKNNPFWSEWDTAVFEFILTEPTEVSMGVQISFGAVQNGLAVILDNFQLFSTEEVEAVEYNYDVTWALANPSFEVDNVVENLEVDTSADDDGTARHNTDNKGAWIAESLTGWDLSIPSTVDVCDLMTKDAAATDNNLGTPGEAADGTYMLYIKETWTGDNTTDASVKQTVSLPAGDYKLTVDSKFHSGGATAKLVAGDNSTDIAINGTASGSSAEDTIFSSEEWTTNTVTFTVAQDGDVTIGVEITFTNSTPGSILLDNFKLYSVEEIEKAISWEMTEAGWGTMILPFAATLADGLTAYSCSGTEESEDEEGNEITVVSLTEVTTGIVANTPYIIKCTDDSAIKAHSFSGVPTPAEDGTYKETYTEGILTGTLVDLAVAKGAAFATDGTNYVLQNHVDENGEEVDDGLAFYPIIVATEDAENSSEATLDAYHCYLTLSSSTSGSGVRAFISLPGSDNEETGIVAVESETLANDAIYDLSGRRVAKAVKGVYIQNGKKVLVK